MGKSNVAALEADLMEKLNGLEGITSKKMFGGYGIFCDKKMFAMISAKEQIFLKINATNQADYEAKGSQRHSRMPYFEVPDDVLENRDLLIEWAGKSIEIALG